MRFALTCTGILALAGSAQADIIDFSGFEHGRIISNQYAHMGVTITADNFSRSFDLAAIFDSDRSSDSRDPDLLYPWDRGNLVGTRLGNMLILAENNTGASDGILDRPDDEANRPAGTFTFDFAQRITYFGMDIIDVEGTVQENGFMAFYRDGNLITQIGFADFQNASSPHFDPTVVFGDNSANRLTPVFASEYEAGGFDRVVVRLGGSGAIDNIVIPGPGAASLLAAASLGLARRRRR